MMVLPPIMAHLEQDLFAEVLYNANEPLCHQYIGRSFCVYNNWMVNDCDLNKTANVTTEFNYYLTNKYSVVASKFDGEYSYNRNLVGIHRAERIDYEDGIYAYKLGVCARDTAIFLGLLKRVRSPSFTAYTRYATTSPSTSVDGSHERSVVSPGVSLFIKLPGREGGIFFVRISTSSVGNDSTSSLSMAVTLTRYVVLLLRFSISYSVSPVSATTR